MTCGAPVAASGTSAMPELLGDMEATFDPADPADIARCIREVLETPGTLRFASGALEAAGRPLHLGAGGAADARGLRTRARDAARAGGGAGAVKRALITGISGQDGSYLAELLLEKGYEVHGLVHGSTDRRFERLEPIIDRITLHPGDLLDEGSLVGRAA